MAPIEKIEDSATAGMFRAFKSQLLELVPLAQRVERLAMASEGTVMRQAS